jgi:hypothetical protein
MRCIGAKVLSPKQRGRFVPKTYEVNVHGRKIDIVQDDDGCFIVPDEFRGLGVALKPAFEPICLARKPLSEKSVAANVLRWGTGALNIDATRIETAECWEGRESPNAKDGVTWGGALNASSSSSHPLGRWPANVVTDGSEEVLSGFPNSESSRAEVKSKPGSIYGNGAGLPSHTGV